MKCDYCGADIRARELAAHVAARHSTEASKDEERRLLAMESEILRQVPLLAGDPIGKLHDKLTQVHSDLRALGIARDPDEAAEMIRAALTSYHVPGVRVDIDVSGNIITPRVTVSSATRIKDMETPKPIPDREDGLLMSININTEAAKAAIRQVIEEMQQGGVYKTIEDVYDAIEQYMLGYVRAIPENTPPHTLNLEISFDIIKQMLEADPNKPDLPRREVPTHLDANTMLACGDYCGHCGAGGGRMAPLHKHGLIAEDMINRSSAAHTIGNFGALPPIEDRTLENIQVSKPLSRAERMPLSISPDRVPCGSWCGWCNTLGMLPRSDLDRRLFAGKTAEQIAQSFGITVEALREEHAKREIGK